MMHIFLQPLDVWLFRDGRPFEAGVDHRARSVFPPYPTVVQGAIRSFELARRGIDPWQRQLMEGAVGTADQLRGLKVKGPFLARELGEGRLIRYFPQPADSTQLAGSPPLIRPASAPKRQTDDLFTSAPTTHLLGLSDPPTKRRESLWVEEDALMHYLQGAEVPTLDASDLFLAEDRIGIALEDTKRTAQEHALYEAQFIRLMPGVGLLVEIEGYEGWPEVGVLQLGGEARVAAYRMVSAQPWPAPPSSLPARFRLYFATPTFFAGGWQPAGGDWRRFLEGEVQLVAAAVGRYEPVSGFDLARQSPKPARRFVPAGSVYYFEARGQARLLTANVTDWGADMGFGLVLCGRW